MNKMRSCVVTLLTVALPVVAHAEKLSQDFRAAFEQTFRTNRTYAVVMREGIPTTSIYGVDGKQRSAHYSVDVQDGEWRTSEGLLDTDQTAADFLRRGELMELASISYKDNRVDLRMVSLEAHKVTRGSWIFKDRKPEPVATNFKFFFPFHAATAADVPQAIDYIAAYLKIFPREDEARAFGARLLSGGEEAPRRTGAGSARSATPREIKTGMTPLQVMEILGKPDKEVTFENTSRWTYPDLTVIFENGRVKDVRF